MEYINIDINPGMIKPVRWMGTTRRELIRFPKQAQRDAGFELFGVQKGDAPSDFKPMTSIGPGVYEIRIHARGEYRLIYIARFSEAIYVLHVFEKRTRKTSKADLDMARRRLAQVVELRHQEKRET